MLSFARGGTNQLHSAAKRLEEILASFEAGQALYILGPYGRTEKISLFIRGRTPSVVVFFLLVFANFAFFLPLINNQYPEGKTTRVSFCLFNSFTDFVK